MPDRPAPARSTPLPPFALLLLLFGCGGLAAAWVIIALISGSQCAWMATLAALAAALLLRLGGAAPGWKRPLAAVVATALTVALANWGIVAAQLAGMMGLGVFESVVRLGPTTAWTMAGLANGPAELAWIAGALVLAAVAAS